MPAFIEEDPYKRYQAVKVVFQSSLRAKVIVERRDSPGEKYIMVVAPKAIKYDGVEIKNTIKEEVTKLLELSHPHLVDVFEAYDHNGYCYWVMEDFASERQTRGHGFGNLTEGQVAQMIKNLASAIIYMHRNDLIHGNLSFDDIEFFTCDDNTLGFQIIDLGMGRFIDEGKYVKHLKKHDLRYGNAPEVVDGKFTKDGDVWTIGAVAYRLMTGDINPIAISDRFADYEENLASQVSISDESRDFIQQCLKINPDERIDTKDIIDHPWFDTVEKRSKDVILNSSVLKNLNKAENENRFKLVASQVVADFIDEEDLAEIKDLFCAMDEDGTGRICHSEFVKALSARIPEEKLTDLFLSVDKDGSGKIAYDEFIGIVLQFKEDIAEQQLIQAFHNMDVDSNGVITVHDLAKLMEIDEDEAKEILYEVISTEVENPEIDQQMFVKLFQKKKSNWFDSLVKLGCQ